MHIDTVFGLILAAAFGAAAYFDYTDEQDASRQVAGEHPATRSAVSRGLSGAILAVIAVILTAFAVDLFMQVPLLLWELTAGLILGSLTLRLLTPAA